MWVETESWGISIPEGTDGLGDAPLLVVPTVHPRGDRRIVRCMQAALDEGLRVHVVWLGCGKPLDHPWIKETLLPAPNSTYERLKLVSTVAKSAKKLGANIWHIHDYYMLGPAKRWHRRERRPVIYDSHEYYGVYYSTKFPGPQWFKQAISKAINLYELSSVKRIGGANLAAANMHDKYEKSNVPFAITPNFPSTRDFDTTHWTHFRERMQSVVYAGSLTEKYGSDFLVELCNRSLERGLPFVFNIIARFPNEDAKLHFLSQIGSSPNGLSNIKLWDTLPAHKVAGILANSGFGLSVLKNHGQAALAIPAKVYEYVVAGTVTVATNLPAQRDFLRSNGVSVISQRDDLDDLLDGMVELTDSPDSTNDKLFAQRQRSLQNLDWEKTCAPALRNLIRKVLDHSQRPKL